MIFSNGKIYYCFKHFVVIILNIFLMSIKQYNNNKFVIMVYNNIINQIDKTKFEINNIYKIHSLQNIVLF